MSDHPPALKIIRTPRFPTGVTVGGLRTQSIPVQKETMVTWFLAHHTPATGLYFGFGEANPTPSSSAPSTSPPDSLALNQEPRIGGFDQGAWFNGGRAPALLKKTFEAGVGPAPIEDVASMFDGLWELKPSEPVMPELPADITSELALTALDDLAAEVQKRAPEHGGIGHNGPPDDGATLTPSDRVIILRATQDAKLALLSKDQPGIQAALDVLAPLVIKLGNGILDQLNNMFTKFTGTIGVAGAVLLIGWVGDEIGIWNKAQVAAWLLSHLAKSLGGG